MRSKNDPNSVITKSQSLASLLNINFRIKPAPKDIYEELMPDEDRITARKNDFFIDEIENFLGIPKALQGVFNQIHGDLYNIKFWHKMQRKVKRGDIADIIPYNKARRFKRRFDFSHFDIGHR
jgi:isocitrate dehydrogenase kinase/phosphatase